VRGPQHAWRSGGVPVAATNDAHVRAKPMQDTQLKQQRELSGHTDVHGLRVIFDEVIAMKGLVGGHPARVLPFPGLRAGQQ
jgi:hypothetical protein